MGIGSFRGWRPFVFSLPLLISLPILFSVQDLSRKHTKKFDHLVLGPAVGQGLRNRLQCRGLKALNRTHSFPTSRILNSSDSISLVTVVAVYNSSLTARRDDKIYDIVMVANPSYGKVERLMTILDTFINFIQVSIPQSNIIILSDPASELPIQRNTVSVLPIPGDYSQEKLMLQRIKCYIGEDLSTRSTGGVQFQIYESIPHAQLALAWVIKSHPSFDAKIFKRPEAFLDQIHGASVLFLPCAVYNWTPPEGAGQFHSMPLDVKVVHFKGSRKRLMLESWNFYSTSPVSDISDMLCLILKSGGTKYDF